MKFNILLIIFTLLLITILNIATPVQPQEKISPTQILIGVLKKAGCTNNLIARYVIDAYHSGISANTLVDRLSGIVFSTTKQVSHW